MGDNMNRYFIVLIVLAKFLIPFQLLLDLVWSHLDLGDLNNLQKIDSALKL